MTLDQLGLRERKRLATRRAIEFAVLSLIQQKGLDRVTVEEVSGRADVSPRTFFNYFPSKEVAAIGDAPALDDDDELAAFIGGAGRNTLAALGRLLVSALDESADDVELVNMRRAVLRENPQLFAMRMASMRTFEEELSDVVARRLSGSPSYAERSADVADRSRLITFVSIAAVRHAWSSWSEDDGRGPLSERILASFDELERLLDPDGEG